jgi:hypothetical protein
MAVAAHSMPNKPMPDGLPKDKKQNKQPDNTQVLMRALAG